MKFSTSTSLLVMIALSASCGGAESEGGGGGGHHRGSTSTSGAASGADGTATATAGSGTGSGDTTSSGTPASSGSEDPTTGTTGSGCSGGEVVCPKGCADLNNDPDNCNSCGYPCPSLFGGHPVCKSGSCGIVCDGGRTLCNGGSTQQACLDLSSDIEHCGSCFKSCVAQGGTPACENGICVGGCFSCRNVVLSGKTPPCTGESQQLYDAYHSCACQGACASKCGSSYCAQATPTLECTQCLSDQLFGCGNSQNDCLNDF